MGMRLLFPFEEVLELVAFNKAHNQASTYVFPGEEAPTQEQLNKKRALHLVGGHGVYLAAGVSGGAPKKIEGGHEGQPVLYAVGCNPHKDAEVFYENKIKAFGGDDGVESIPVSVILQAHLEMQKEGVAPEEMYLFISLSKASMEIGVVSKPKPKKKGPKNASRKGR